MEGLQQHKNTLSLRRNIRRRDMHERYPKKDSRDNLLRIYRFMELLSDSNLETSKDLVKMLTTWSLVRAYSMETTLSSTKLWMKLCLMLRSLFLKWKRKVLNYILKTLMLSIFLTLLLLIFTMIHFCSFWTNLGVGNIRWLHFLSQNQVRCMQFTPDLSKSYSQWKTYILKQFYNLDNEIRVLTNDLDIPKSFPCSEKQILCCWRSCKLVIFNPMAFFWC